MGESERERERAILRASIRWQVSQLSIRRDTEGTQTRDPNVGAFMIKILICPAYFFIGTRREE